MSSDVDPFAVTPYVPFEVSLPSRHKAAAIALFASCTAMVFGLASFGWFTHGNAGIGLFGVRTCAWDAGCSTTTWLAAKGAPAIVTPFGLVGVVALAASIVLAIHAGVTLLQGGRVQRLALEIALSVAAVAVIGFGYAVFGSTVGSGAHLGYAGFVALAGLAGAGVALGVIGDRAAR
jgi:hypothetical protein